MKLDYTFSGEKVKKQLEGTESETRLYMGGAELKDGQAEAYYHSEGRVLLADGTPRFQYQIGDHLGNLAVFFEDKDQDGIILTEATASDPTKVEVLQRHFYYPFGLNFEGHWEAQDEAENKYQYNGKELAKDLDLGWYFYGARMHDPAIGRFTGVDPIADRFAWVSSYNYAENEPVGHIDLWGLQQAEYDIRSNQGVDFNSIMGSMIKVAQQVVNDLKGSGALEMKTGLAQADFVLTAASLNSTIKDNSLSSQSKNEKITATVIGEAASFYAPLFGLAVGGLAQDATNEDGLTNLKNGRLAEAYSQNFNQTQQGNVHLQKALGKEKESQGNNTSEEIGYYTRQYAEIDIATGKTVNGQVVMKRGKFYQGSEMYNILTSPTNQPGQPGYNETTSFGIEIHQYKTQKKK
jgi:RHS repeat-associated protein